MTFYQVSRTYTGEIAALRTSNLGFSHSGEIETVLVREGDRITKGQSLTKLDIRNLQTQRKQLVAEKARAQAQLEELQRGARFEEIDAAKAGAKDLEQQLQLKEKQRSRREFLYQEGAISKEDLDGFSTVTIELLDSVKNAQPIWSKVRDEMDDAYADFPPGVGVPELDEAKVKAYTAIASLTWNQPSKPNYPVLRRYAEQLEVAMRGVKGTEEVKIFGDPTEEITVEIDATKLVSVGLSAQELAEQINLSDFLSKFQVRL